MQDSGPLFVSAGDDIKLWDPSTLQVVKQYNYHKGNIKGLAWSRDNSLLCSTSSSGDKILLCDCNGKIPREKPKIVAEHAIGEHQTCVCISPNGRKIYSGGVDGGVCIWDTDTGKLRKSYKDTHSSPITCIALNDSETHFASGSSKGDIVIRNLSNDTKMRPIKNIKNQAVRAMSFSPWKHSLLGMTMDDGSLNLWDTLNNTTYHDFNEIHKAPAMDLVFSPFNDLVLASVGLDKHLMIYDVKKHKFVNKVTADQPLTSLTFMHDGYTLFAGTSLGRIYHFDLRYFNKPVKDVLAHSTSVHRIAVQNVIKVKKSRLKSSKNETSKVHERRGAGDEVVTSKAQRPQHDNRKNEKGDFVDQPSLASKSSSNYEATYAGSGYTNGFHENTKVKTKPFENSTPTAKGPRILPHHVDDLGGVISPVREEVFDNYSITSVDGNTSAFPPDTTIAGATFSSNSSIGSYCDDILSPVGNSTKPSKGRTPVGVQIHSRTSPHPLRQSHNFITETDSNTYQSPAYRSRLGAGSSAVVISTPTEVKNETRENNHDYSDSSATPVANETCLHQESETKAITLTVPSDSIAQHKDQAKMLTVLPSSSQSQDLKPETSLNPSFRGTHPSGPSSSHPNLTGAARSNDMTAFEYQAEFLRNTVKELVDEVGENLRCQINEVMTNILNISIRQEDLIQQLLQRRCGVNEQLLLEIERLKEENERLRRVF